VSEAAVFDWLLEGDPSIRWQVQRDLLDLPESKWQAERQRGVETGWMAEMLACQGRDGEWPAGRWTASVWVLLLLVALGIPEEHPAARAPLERVLDKYVPDGVDTDPAFLLRRMDLCHLGFWLRLLVHFLPEDERVRPIREAVLSAQYADGGWNCQMRNYPERLHSSFHTTFNVLEGLRPAAARGSVPAKATADAEARALEFMLAHRLYRSDKSGEPISERFTQLSYPWHWHYTTLRALDYLRVTPAINDARLDDALQLLAAARKPNGRWPLQKRIPGTLLVEMEKPGGESRWNTLRALRVLRAREATRSS
jgi:hypothetical protein